MKIKLKGNKLNVTATDSGELVDVGKEFTLSLGKTTFYRLYINLMSKAFGLSSSVDINLLSELCAIADQSTGKLFLTSARRIELGIKCKLSTQQITNSLKNLKTLDILTGTQGDYIISRSVFWIGPFERRKDYSKTGLGSVRVLITFE